jgi:hypothetical protein
VHRWFGYRALLVVLLCAVAACDSTGSTATPQSSLYGAPPEWQRETVPISEPDELVEVGDDIQAALDRAGEDGEVVIRSGIHRTGNLRPMRGQVILGEAGAILSGMEPVGPFRQQDSGVWVAAVPAIVESEDGTCRRERPICAQPQDLVVDGELIQRVGASSEIGDNSWYLDNESESVVLPFNPGDSEVEIGVRSFAFVGDARDVTIRGLVIEGYASPAQQGAITGRGGWKIINNEIRFNHAVGIKTAGTMEIVGNYIHHNGHFAMSGGGVDLEITDNEIAFNGVAGYSPFWGSGGAKFVATHGLHVSRNLVYGNQGAGLWTDGAGEDTTYSHNKVFDNEHAGIKHEISGSVIMEHNEVAGNGFGHEFPPRGAGIFIRESGPAVVRDNTIYGNADELILLHQDERENSHDRVLKDITIEGNTIRIDQSLVGLFGDITSNMNIQFDGNQYLGDSNQRVFLLLGREVGWTDWIEAGYDQASSFEAAEESTAISGP